MQSKQKIKAVLTDIDDTITDTQSLYKAALHVCCDVFNDYTGLKYSIDDFNKLYTKAREDVKSLVPTSAAKHNRAIYFQRLVENLDFQTDFDLIHSLYEAYYDHVYENMTLYPGVLEFFSWLKETGRKIVAVSDGNTHVRIKKLYRLGIGKYIDYLVSSEEVGVEKPSNQPFLVALNKVQLSAQDVIFIGNKAESDIRGANRLGIISVEIMINNDEDDKDVNRGELEIPKYSTKDFAEVRKLIECVELENV